MSFGECTITFQDVAYNLGLPIDGHYISRCLMDFQRFIEGGRLAWDWFQELLGMLPPTNCIDKFTVKCTWMQETFSHLPHDADKETVRTYARLFDDKSGIRMHIQWLPYVARLEDMDGYSWGSAALS
ncbi:hypothetical protein Ahy_B02g061055 [Arachis hypogaea]|uniref:Aminotransferase-like plant mobile domain-containing protein n=1 Tax=Arachis hypogaea TaxID=3818 RepID=A0A445AJX1_ARAHY|nr:hypothetical protein Ahy_B02g061055 [Arachis hypogaea]